MSEYSSKKQLYLILLINSNLLMIKVELSEML